MRKIVLILNLLPAIVMANPPMHPPQGEFGKPPMHRFRDGGEHLPPYLHDIDLTEQQKTEIKNLIKTQDAEISDNWEKEKNVKAQLHQLSFSNNYNEDAALALIEASLKMHKDMVLQKSKLDNAIFKQLNARQQGKLNALMEKLEH